MCTKNHPKTIPKSVKNRSENRLRKKTPLEALLGGSWAPLGLSWAPLGALQGCILVTKTASKKSSGNHFFEKIAREGPRGLPDPPETIFSPIFVNFETVFRPNFDNFGTLREPKNDDFKIVSEAFLFLPFVSLCSTFAFLPFSSPSPLTPLPPRTCLEAEGG